MSSTLHTEIIRCRQQEAATQAIHARQAREARALSGPRHNTIRYRVVGALAAATAAVGLCVAVASAKSVNVQATQRAAQIGQTATTGRRSAPYTAASGATAATPARFVADVRRLERNGYVQCLCTRTGMLMHNPNTGRFATARW
jgi:type IV secretory pathway TrbF-like protein